MTQSPDRRIVAAKRAPLRAAAATAALCTMWSVLPGCTVQTPEHAGDGAQQPRQGSTVTHTLRIEQHFNGPELALAQASAAGDAAQVARLVGEDHADPNAVSPGGLPLIAWPVLQGNAAGVRALLEHGADANRAAPAAGTVMTWAAKAEDPAVLQAFLEHGGNANAIDNNGEPLTRVAALAGRWDNVKLLVEHGADIDATAHGQPNTSLLAYYSAGQFDKAHWLLEHGADPGYRIETAPSEDRVGAQPIVENIYWWPVQAGRFPQLAQWQQRCQSLLAARGLSVPAEPPHLARLRASQGGDGGNASTPRDLDAEIREHEAGLRQRLGEG
jgi:ankyrin repeat protein